MIRPSVRRHLGGLLVAPAAFGLFGLLLVGAIRERWAARRAFPTEEGRVGVSGLSTTVSIFRDEHGIAHAEARTREDALSRWASSTRRIASRRWSGCCGSPGGAPPR